MPADIDIVGTAAVDVVPIAPAFHDKLKTVVLPAADRVGEEAGRRMGDAISRHLTVDIPDAVVTGGRRARVAATREGEQAGGAMGRAIQRQLEVAFRALPRANVRLGDTGINADIDRLRSRIQALSGRTLGIDLDAGAALAEISDLDARLARLAASNPSIQVQTDTAVARAALAEVQRQINATDRDDVNIRVDVDTSKAMAALRFLGIALGGVAAIPVVPVAAAGIGAIASAAVAAGAGVGALALAAVPAIKSVTAAIQAKSAAEKQSATATDNSAASSVKAAQQALTLANAQASLSSAHRQAASSVAAANRQVQDSERALSDAKRAARDAELDLTQARRDATQQLADLQDKLIDGALSERDATLRVQEAQQELNQARSDASVGKATDLQVQRAQLAYDQAVQNAKEQRKSVADLKKQEADARKAGVDGTDVVKQAKDRLSDANRRVADQTRAVADAEQKARESQVQAAESIASAERGVQAARLSSVDTTTQAVSKADEYRKALAKLTPEQRALFDSIAGPKGITAAFKNWAASLAPDVVPLFTRSVNAAKSALPGLTPLVRGAVDGVEELQDAASREVKEPFWSRFRRDIDKSVTPAVVGFGKTFGNVIAGAAGVVDAFLPSIDDIADRMVRSSGKFANWGKNLQGSPEFEGFLKYADEHGPIIADTIGKIAGAVLSVGSALSPLSGPLLKLIGGVAEGIGIVADKAPWFILLLYGIITAVKLWTLAQVALNLVMSANPLVLIGLAILALVALVVYAWNKFDGFRNAIQTAWRWITDATSWAWSNVLEPFFTWFGGVVVWLWQKIIKPHIDFVVAIFRGLADAVMWLWSGIFSPVFGFIGALIVWWWKNIVKKQFDLVMGIVKDVGGAFKWLYEKAIKPHLEDIGDVAEWLYDHTLKPVFKNIRDGVDLVADSFSDAKRRIKSSWDDVARIAIAPVNWLIDASYTRGLKALWDKVSKYVGLDPLPNAPKLLQAPKKFARGGPITGGTPGVDSVPLLAMGGEYIVRRDSVAKLGVGTMDYINRNGALPKFAGGGIVGALGNAFDWTAGKISGAVSKGVDWAEAGASLLADPSKAWTRLVKPILDGVTRNLSGSDMARTLAMYPAKLVDSLKGKLTEAVTFSGGGDIGG
ncbi:hypothetical protein, partial [Streptomyces sp. NPDC026666]|uniref:hypothetical protein n=1 Tax=Streptomyces sp. NPDC026666 TaxID=3154799 RepID=UPI003451DC7B